MLVVAKHSSSPSSSSHVYWGLKYTMYLPAPLLFSRYIILMQNLRLIKLWQRRSGSIDHRMYKFRRLTHLRPGRLVMRNTEECDGQTDRDLQASSHQDPSLTSFSGSIATVLIWVLHQSPKFGLNYKVTHAFSFCHQLGTDVCIILLLDVCVHISLCMGMSVNHLGVMHNFCMISWAEQRRNDSLFLFFRGSVCSISTFTVFEKHLRMLYVPNLITIYTKPLQVT